MRAGDAMILLVDVASYDGTCSRRAPSSHLRRLGSVLASTGQDVGFVDWHQVEVLTDDVRIRGNPVDLDGGEVAPPALGALALLFHPLSGISRPPFTEWERAAVRRLRAGGLVGRNERPSRLSCVTRTVGAAGRHGLVVNSPGLLGRWGRKDQLEMALRAARRSGAPAAPRPETYVMPAAQVWAAVGSFHARGRTCVVKPANGARGERISILRPGQTVPGLDPGPWIVQELLGSPLQIDGNKADLRAFVCVSFATGLEVSLMRPILVRIASEPYAEGWAPAEVTNTAFRKRRGLEPAILPLDEAITDASLRTAIRSSVEETVEALAGAVRAHVRRAHPASRILVWGIDVFVRDLDGDVSTLLLEVNVYPRFFRGAPAADEAVGTMWLDEVLPRILAASGSR